MWRGMVVWSGMLLAACPPALAQDAPPAPVPAADQAVLVYPASFFASAGPNTALDMILRVPGFTFDEGDLSSRGLSGAAGNVLIDGTRPASKSDSVGQVLQRVPAASVARIELIRGGAPGIDMRGRAVVANVILTRTATTELVAEANAFLYDDGDAGPSGRLSYTRRDGDRVTEASLFVADDRTSNTAHGRRIRSDAGGAPLQVAGLDLRDRYQDVNARVALQRPLLRGKLQANAVLEAFRLGDTQVTTIVGGAGDDEHVAERNDNPSGELGFTWTRSPGPRTTLELTGLQRLNRARYRGAFDSADARTVFASSATGGESVARLTDTFRPNPRWTFEAGGEIAYNVLDGASTYAADGVDVALPNADVAVSELRGEAFAQATWQPSGKLTLDGTMRVEQSRIAQTGALARSRSFTYPKPKLQVTWLPHDGHQVRLLIEQEVGQLDFGDFAASSELALGTVRGGNADLRPQRKTTVELVYERRFWKKGVIELTARHNALYDVIDTIPLAGGFDATGNIGSGRGTYLGAALTLPFDRLGVKDALLKVSGGYVGSRVIDPLTGLPRRRANQPPFGCDITFTHDLKGGRFSYGFEHGCVVERNVSYRTAELRVDRYPPFAYVYGQWKPTADLTLRLDMGNLVNGARATLRDVYAGPRDTAPLLFHEDRASRRGRYAYVQVRKTL